MIPLDTIFNKINGLHTEGECELLREYAGKVSEGVIVELGSFQGLSAIMLADGSNVPVYAVDPHELTGGHYSGDGDRAAFCENVLRYGHAGRIRQVNLLSSEAAYGWSMPIGLVFIDADHSYESVKQDLSLWFPHVVPGGFVIVHDMNLPGIPEAVAEWSGKMELVASVDVMNVYRKVRD